jgi:hypothetical protein
MTLPADLHRLVLALAEASGVTPEWMANRLRTMPLSELATMVGKLPANIKAGLAHYPSLAEFLGPDKWVPSPGPQTLAYESAADVLLYGGSPGSGKTDLLLGLAFTKHQRSFIVRRAYGDLAAIIDRALKLHGSKGGFNASPPPRLRISENQVIYFRTSEGEGAQGQARDFLGIDEACQLRESDVRFLMAWVRSEDPEQRCRVVLATNPPLSSEGLWAMTMFEPWLSDRYHNPAKPGELRWVITDEAGKDLWVNGPDDTRVIDGRLMKPMSRTYIPGVLADNPYLMRTNYQSTLDAMPEPFRSQLLGQFKTSLKDQDSQVCPTAWVKAAMARWKADGWKAYTMTAMALDPAGGGDDPAALAWRHGPWYAPLLTLSGAATRDGAQMAAQVLAQRRANAALVIDMGGGFGTDVSSRLKENGISFQAFNGANKASGASMGGLKFYNARAEAWWRFREELNPDREGGAEIALPDDPELLADLTAPTFDVRTTGGILIESKEDIRKRLGRSTNKGDACVMALAPGNTAVKRQINERRREDRPKFANVGFAHLKPWAKRSGGGGR